MNGSSRWRYVIAGLLAAGNAQASNDPYPDAAAYKAALAECERCEDAQRRKCLAEAFERRPADAANDSTPVLSNNLQEVLGQPGSEAAARVLDSIAPVTDGIPLGGNEYVECSIKLDKLRCKY